MEYENRFYAVYVRVNDQDLIYAVNSFTKPLKSDSIRVFGHWEAVADILE